MQKLIKIRRIILFNLLLIALIGTLFVFVQPVLAAPTDAYWVGGTGNWTDATNHWATTSNGTPDAANTPAATTNVHFDASSFTAANQTVTINATANCLNMDWTGATNTPTLTLGNNSIYVYGNVTFIAAMVNTAGGTGAYYFCGSGKTLTTNTLVLGSRVWAYDPNTSLTLVDALTQSSGNGSAGLYVYKGIFNSGNQTITTNFVSSNYNTTRTITLGSSSITIVAATGWSFADTTNLTLTANTSTINITGTGAFAGGNITTYNNINLIGSAHTVSGAFTCNTLALPSATTQTITMTAGNKITATTATLSGDATHQHTIKSGTAGTLSSIWATNKTDNYVTYTDMLRNYNGVIVANCAGAGGGTFAGAGGTYTSLTQEGAGNYALTITGSNTFNTFTVDRSQANKTLTITTGSNQQFADFVCATSGTNTLSINSSTTTAATFTKTGGGTVVLDYVNVTYMTGSPASTWAYGTHGSGDAWSNTNGWTAEFITALLGVQPGALISGQIIITPATSTQFNVSWEAKSGATYLVRAKRFRNPISPTSGYFVYQGTVNTCSSIRESNTRYVVYWLDSNGTWILWACKNIYRDGAY